MKSLVAAVLKWCQAPDRATNTAKNISECVSPPAYSRI